VELHQCLYIYLIYKHIDHFTALPESKLIQKESRTGIKLINKNTITGRESGSVGISSVLDTAYLLYKSRKKSQKSERPLYLETEKMFLLFDPL
jgi:hypothetical protein